jgi:PAS domain S-box-containing protein
MAATARLEQDLRGQEALLRELTENIHQVFWLSSVDQLQKFYVSPSYEHIFGRSCDGLLRNPMSWLEAIHPDDRPRIEAEVARPCGGRFTLEYRIIRPDGAIRWILARGYPVRDNRGHICRIAGLAEDITERKQAEAAIQQLAAIVGSSEDAIISEDLDGRIRTWNRAAERIFGYLAKEVIGQNIALLIPGNRTADEVAILEEMRKGKRIRHYETTRLKKDGTPLLVSLTISPVRDASGEIVGASKIMRDLSERRQAGEALRRSETKFRTLYDTTSDAIMLLGEKGFFDCNPATLAVYGCATREEFLSKHPADLSPPTQPDGTDSRTLANRQIATAMEKGSHQFEWMHKRADTGEVFPADVLLSAMELDGKRVLQATVRDLTERKQAEEAVSRAQEIQRAIFDSTSDFIWAVDAQDFRLLTFNRAFRDYSLQQRGKRLSVGQRPEDLLPNADYIERWRGYFQQALASGPFTTEYLAASGKVTLLLTFNLLKQDGAVFGVSVFGKDITERKQAERRMRMFSHAIVAAREEERRRVSSALHHDVGFLAVGVSAYLDAIEKDLRSGKPAQALRWMNWTRKLFDQSVARLKNLAVEIRPPELDVLGLSAALRQHFSRITTQRGARIRFRETRQGPPVSANAATILFRVAQEALTNAIQHGRAKQVDVDFRASKEEIRLTVRDNGKGFDPSQPRRRATPQLGLRVMREMAASAGGAFAVESRRGKGTTVRLSLPMETAPASAPLAPPPRPGRTRRRGKTIRSASGSSRRQKGSLP